MSNIDLKKTQLRSPIRNRDLLAGMTSTLSYLEAIAFREELPLLFAALRIAQWAVNSEMEVKEDMEKFKRGVEKILTEI